MRLHFSPTTIHSPTRLLMVTSILGGLMAIGLSGSAAWADSSCIPPATGGPTGSDAQAFTYQCTGPYAGEWTSTYYVYNSATNTESPLYAETYSYDCTKDTWAQNEWQYEPSTGTYTENWVPATTTPNQPTNCPTSATSTTNGSALNSATTSSAQSGSATVADNNTAGNATSGNSSTEVTDTNSVDTTGNALGSGVTTFTSNIGDMNGNLVLDPSTILPAGTTASGQPTAALSSTTTDASIANTITATAASGNAVVAGNGDAGNATSGNAEAIVNLINIINSAVAAGRSFIGTININGDLNGDILIPQSVIDQILGSNAGNSNNPSTTNSTNESITNNIDATAQSGNATVADNTGAYGSATTGTANTNVTILNLTGSSVIGKNVLLVFVNDLGRWVGMIVNAPAGATSAEFGGGITSATPSTNSSIVEATANLGITNNVDASAITGDASVVGNQNAGNATSGDASTAVNILNVENSVLSLANWFGVLFINVFGTWNGNFGILPTPAPAASAPMPGTNSSTPNATAQTATIYAPEHFATFIPDANNGTTSTSSNASADSAVLGDAIATPAAKKIQGSALPASDNGAHANYLLPVLGFLAASLLLATSERDKLFRRNKG